MSLKLYYEQDTSLEPILEKKLPLSVMAAKDTLMHSTLKKVALMSWSVQNLQPVSPVLKPKVPGLKTASIGEASEWADLIMLLIPDEVMGETYSKDI